MAIRECLACEKSFDPLAAVRGGVSLKNAETYCTPKCESEFEQFLTASATHAESIGLASSTNPTVSNDQIKAIAAHFKIRMTGDTSE